MEVDNLMVEDSRYSSPGTAPPEAYSADNPEVIPTLGSELLPPAISVGSVGDVQSYWLGTGNDTSEYNTEYEDCVADIDSTSQGPDGKFDEESVHNS